MATLEDTGKTPITSTTTKDAYNGQDVETNSSTASSPPQKLPLSKRILRVLWDSLDKSPEERALVAKMDWWILSYCCVAYFVKYLDQTNVSNAYVSGMKGDLNMVGNDLNYLTTYWTIGYILGNVPSQIALTYIRPSIWLPSLELLWGCVVMAMAGAKNIETMYGLRFLSGLLEASAYPGIMTLLGNWYTPAELGKRACIFQASSSAAQLFSGYLQAALYKGMDGTAGLAAWRWLFIFDGIIGIPISLYGFFAIPDSPTTARARWISGREKEIATQRMATVGRKPFSKDKLNWSVIKKILLSWPIHLFSATFIAHVCAIRVYSYFNVWLTSTHRWSVAEVNILPSIGYGLQIVFTLCYAWTSDALGMRWPVIVFAGGVALIGCIILSVWPSENIPAMFVGWLLTFCETGAGALIITWINEILSHSAEERALVIGCVEAIAFTFYAWVPLLVYNTGQSPHFKIGYPMAAMFFAIEIVLTVVIAFCVKKWPQGPRKGEEEEVAQEIFEERQ
ncbi:hypothetical protein SBRCBS47491_004697 [Sporothrix bragantina]|uniref:Major facilitator superfamily (MFS) profile domain-containing protein n=1 Tax=Sporothrix bragantina TaxID=671064 RepID=A0ABP0BS99_9PEZI